MSMTKHGAAFRAASELTRTRISSVSAQYVAWIESKASEAAAIDALLGAADRSKRPERVLVLADELYDTLDDYPASMPQLPAYLDQAALSGTYASLTAAAYNVLNTGDPKRDAIADGQPHPLSERFATLALAQAKFPRATALTEQIDRHALQYALDNYAHVVAPQGAGEYRIDSTVYTSAADSARGLGNQTFHMLGLATLKPVDGAANTTWFASGNARTSGFVANADGNTTPACDNLQLRVRLDGNKDNVTGGNSWGFYTVRCNNIEHDVEVFNVKGSGFVLYGANNVYTENVLLRRVWAHDNTARGIQVSLRNRKVHYADVRAWANTGDGVYFDHSESRSSSIQSWDNGGTGIEIHNVSRVNVGGLRSTGNGGHGILVSGLVASEGSGWVATGNGTAGTQYNDVHFDARAGSYGTSKSSRFSNITCGAYLDGGDTAHAGYALYVEDGVTNDVEIVGVKVTENEVSGDVRVPAVPGKLTVQASGAGSTFQRYRAGGGERTVTKSADQTVNNTTTPVVDTELGIDVSAGETWLLEFTLGIQGANTTADFKYGIDAPAGSTGEIYNVQGVQTTGTGGVGQGYPGRQWLNGTLAVGTFASLSTQIVRARVVAGADGKVSLRWAQNTADASDLTVTTGSLLHARRIS